MMQNLYRLYQGWIVFWSTYIIGSLWFPSSKAVTRPTVTTSTKNVITNLMVNSFVTFVAIIPISYIPPIVVMGDTSFDLIIKYGSLLILSDIWFYYTHRLMHSPYLYKFHKQHHEFIHPYALAGLYCSPLEMVFVNQISISLPIQMLDYNTTEIMVFSGLIALNVLKGHSGIQFYWCDPKWFHKMMVFFFGNKMHDIHHEYMNCNYGNLYFLDLIHNTIKF